MDAALRAKPELVERIARLAAETESSPEELALALDDYRARVEALRALIDEGLNSGEPVDGEIVFAELLAELERGANARG